MKKLSVLINIHLPYNTAISFWGIYLRIAVIKEHKNPESISQGLETFFLLQWGGWRA